MTQISRDEFQQIVSGAPEGTDPKELINGLQSRGHTLEGLASPEAPKRSIFQKVIDRSSVGAIKEAGGDVLDFGKGILESGKEKIGEVGEIKEKRKEGEIGFLESRLQTAGKGGEFIGDVFGEGIKGIGKLLLSEEAEEAVGEKVTTGLTKMLETDQGKKAIKAFQTGGEVLERLKKENPRLANNVEALIGIAEGVSSVFAVGSAASIAKTGIKTGVDVAEKGIETGTEIVKKGVSKIRHPFKTSGEVISATHKKIIDRRLKKTEGVPSEVSKVAEKSGFEKPQADFVSTMSKQDKQVATKLQDMAEEALVNKRSIRRPTDLVGENMIKKQKPIEELRKKFGKEVDDAAKSLKGKKVETSELIEKIDNVIDDLNIEIIDNKFDFKNSVFKNIPQIQKQLTTAFEDALSLNSDAFKTHIFKKSIDEIVDFGTTGEGLKGTAAAKLKGLRKQADTILDNNFDDYKLANDKFKEVIGVLNKGSKLFGRTGINEQKAGQLMRRVFSNAASRGDIMEFLDELDVVAKKFKVETGDNLLDQAIFTELLEGIYGTQATTSLQGEVSKAIGAAKKIISALRDPIRGTGEIVADVAESALGKSDELKKDFLRKILKENNNNKTKKFITE